MYQIYFDSKMKGINYKGGWIPLLPLLFENTPAKFLETNDVDFFNFCKRNYVGRIIGLKISGENVTLAEISAVLDKVKDEVFHSQPAVIETVKVIKNEDAPNELVKITFTKDNPPTKEELQYYSYKKLQEMARDLKIEFNTKISKDDLMNLILAQFNSVELVKIDSPLNEFGYKELFKAGVKKAE
jgi:hypothetical protein